MRPDLAFVGPVEALVPALPNTSLLVRGPQTLLLDCGYAVPHALWRITREVELLDAIWISHTHADHLFGLPALLLWMRLGGRRRPLTILCGPGQAATIEQVLELGYPGSFAPHKCYPIELHELRRDTGNRFGDFDLRIAPSAHSIVNYALRLETEGMRSLVYSGDGHPTEATRELCRGAAVLIHECFFPAATGQRKHGDVDSCVELARASAIETLALLHFESELVQAIVERARSRVGDDLELLLPSPGDTLALGNHD